MERKCEPVTPFFFAIFEVGKRGGVVRFAELGYRNTNRRSSFPKE
jgi:hypothetical protein